MQRCRLVSVPTVVKLKSVERLRASVPRTLHARPFLPLLAVNRDSKLSACSPQIAVTTFQLLPLDWYHFSCAACLQPLELPLGQHQPLNVSEECLTVNIYTPSGCSIRNGGGGALPVLFFVTGWHLYTLNWNGMFDWHQLASRGRLVVVVPNYRVGVFGFLSRDRNGTSNMGVRDVLLAWQWTRTHIRAFGGDPSSVVPLGHASGSIIMSALLTRPHLLKCRRAILLSQTLFNLADGSKEMGLLRARTVGHQANCCAVHECPSMPVPGNVLFRSRLSLRKERFTLGRIKTLTINN